MTINPNLQLLMEKMFDDEQTLEKIMKTDDMEELYQVCLTIQDGYTLKEFVDFFEKLVDVCREESKEIETLEDSELKDVSGGVSNLNRLTASALASLTFLTANHLGVYAEPILDADGNPTGNVVMRKAEPGEKEETEKRIEKFDEVLGQKPEFRPALNYDERKNQSFGTEVAKWFSKAADTVYEHKGAILVASVALIVGGGFLIGESEQISKNINNYKKRKDKRRKYETEMAKLIEQPSNKDTADAIAALRLKMEENDKQSPSKILTDKLLIAGTAASGLSTLWDLLKKGFSKFKGLGEVVHTFTNMATDIQFQLNKYRAKKKEWQLWAQTQQDFDYNDGGAELNRLFEHYVRGQESAKKQLRTFYNIFASALEDEKNGIATEQQLAPQVLVFNGPSGTGKTFMAGLLAKCLTNIDPFIISAGAILKDVEASKAGGWGGIDVKTAFWTGGKCLGAGKDDNGVSYNNLASYIESTQGSVRVIIIDEYDKLYQSGAKHPLDEEIRDILSNTVKNPFTQVPLDLSKTIFICTTNETKASLQGRIVMRNGRLQEKAVDEDGNLMFDENSRQVYIDPTDDDDSGTQTHIPHDPSVTKRFQNQTCFFDALKHEDYLKIVHDALDDDPTIKTLEDLQAIGGTNKVMLRHRIRYGIARIEMDSEGYELIAKYAAGTTSAARAIVGAGGNTGGSVAGNLDSALTEQIGKWQADYDVKNMKIKVIPRLETNSAGVREVKFDVEFLGYAD